MPCQTLHLDETSSSAPDISPGVVEDAEPLLRSLFNPDHIRDGQIQPSAIPLKDLQERGFSVNRLRFVTQEFVEDSISRILARTFQGSARESEGVAYFRASAVRDVRDNDTRVFVVIDTALPENHGHASIYLADLKLKPSQARRMREKLMPILRDRVSVSQAFGRLVEDSAP